MMTQSVMTQAANLFGNAASSVTTKGKQTGTGFDMLMNNNLKAIQNPSGNTDTGAVKKTSVQKSENADLVSDSKASVTDQTGAAQNKTDTVSDNNPDQTKATKTSDTKAAEETKDVKDNTEDETAPDEQLVAQIEALLANVQQTVMDALKLSPEEFNQLLSDQGMSVTDLLQPENLQQFILASQGTTDITAVLTDENLAATMKDLMKSVDELMQNADMDLAPEEMKEILAKAEEWKLAPQEDNVPVFDGTADKQITEEKSEKQPEAVNARSSVADGNKTQEGTTEAAKLADQTVKTESTSESSTSSQSDKRQEDQRDLKAEDAFQTFVDNLVKTREAPQVEFSGNMVQVTQLREIANQIIDRIRISVTPDTSSMELQLNPENLGKVNLTVQSKNGVMTAQFVVQNEVSKEAIESQLSTLKETLNSQGIKVEAIEVSVAAYAFDQNNQDGRNSETDGQKENTGRKISLEEAMNMTDTPAEENTEADATGILGSMVDYTA